MFVTIRLSIGLLVTLLVVAACAAPSRPSYQPGSPNSPSSPQTSAPKDQPVEDSNVEHVRNVVNLRQVQLQNLYKRQSSVQAMQGELSIKLFITEEGVVQQSEISPNSGNLSSEFIAQVKNEIMTWRFILRDKVIYSFKIQFRKM